MEQKALAAWRKFCQLPSLWRGWDHAKTPIAYFDAEKAFMFGHPSPPKDFQKRSSQGQKYHFAVTKPVSFTANTGMEYGGRFIATIMWGDRQEGTLVPLTAHEAFHAHQMERGCPLGNISIAMTYPVNNPEINALGGVEATLLYEAIKQKGNEDLVKAALDARAARQQLLETEVAEYEDEVELGEGLATYIEMKCADSDVWNSKLGLLLKANRNAWGADRLRFYYTGAAWAFLCDAYAGEWQDGNWQIMSKHVAKGIGHIPDGKRREFPGINFSQILSNNVLEAKERQRKIDEDMARALPGTGLRVEVKTTSTPVGGGWNPNTAVTFPGIGRFHPTGLMYIYDTGTEFKVEKDGIEFKAISHLAFERPDLTVQLDGKPAQEGEGEGRLEITGPDCKVSIPRARIDYRPGILIAEEIN